MDDYLNSLKKQFEYYKTLGEKTFNQLNEEQLFWKFNEESNNIAIIVNHLAGNMLSRWTNFLTSDGEKDWRKRDQEFENTLKNKAEVLAHWENGWACLFNAINSVNSKQLQSIIYIRNQGHTVLEAFNRQLAHYPYHVGQIVMLGKMLCDEKWQSLSIPKGNSNAYNAEKFAQQKHREHFTDDFLNQKP